MGDCFAELANNVNTRRVCLAVRQSTNDGWGGKRGKRPGDWALDVKVEAVDVGERREDGGEDGHGVGECVVNCDEKGGSAVDLVDDITNGRGKCCGRVGGIGA